LAALAQRLGQPDDVVYTALVRSAAGGAPRVGDTRLLDGDVVLLDDNRVHRSVLATIDPLPAPVPLEAPAVEETSAPSLDSANLIPFRFSEPEGAEYAALPTAPSLDALPGLAAPRSETESSATAVAKSDSWIDSPDMESADRDEQIIAAAASGARAPTADSEPRMPLAASGPSWPNSVHGAAPATTGQHESLLFTADAPTSPPAGIASPDESAAAPPALRTAGVGADLRLLVGLGILGCTGLGAWLWRQVLRTPVETRLQQYRPPVAPATTTAPATSPPAVSKEVAALEDLVSDRLDLTEEALSLPEHIGLHGRAVGQYRQIFHPAHPLPGPHFTAPARSEPTRESVFAGRQESSVNGPAASSLPTYRLDPGPRPGGSRGSTPAPLADDAAGGLLERVLLAMQREGRR
jgi:hypothetical protein